MIDFLVVGTQKSATSWLYYCLTEHPRLCLPGKKREIEYLGGAEFERRGLQWFRDRYPPCDPSRLRGDVSVDYLVSTGALATLRDMDLRPKIICCVRDPVERILSAFYWKLRTGAIPEMQIDHAVDLLVSGRSSGDEDLDRELQDLVRRGEYGRHLVPYMELVGPKRILILPYHAIAEEPGAVVRRVFEFLGVDPGVSIGALHMKPKRNSYSRPMIRLERRFRGSRVAVKIFDLVNRVLARRRSDPLDDPIARDRLRELFRQDFERFADLLASLPEQWRPDPSDIARRWGFR